ncbi:Uncharacterised protein [Sphingobacterium spiritivorum]|uniref:YD repeat (Two copies) n=1 Tax=Sphingobacterium spiritivorum TaxID=258 RepID=A0A380CJZ1_SPHSI|nr:hypothetical protein [Sphingobacterium spiritivorum]SUJ22105.1 Uncharacterised protein [Sphingobacterium spiritivorum]
MEKFINSIVYKGISTLIIWSIIVSAIAQEISPVAINIIPPSPHVYSTIKQNDFTIGLFSGTAQYSIPLFNISSGSITLPVSLNYSSNGIKVDEVPGRTGMNWNLTTGALISRSVRGYPDDNIGVTHARPLDHKIYGDNFWYFLEKFYNVPYTSTYDSQPDVFSLSGLGLSGQFYIDNGVIKQINNTGYKIEVFRAEPTVKIQSFKVTDGDGVQYFFGENGAGSTSKGFDQENEHESAKNKAQIAWFLTRIINSKGDIIEFEYSIAKEVEYYSGVSNSYRTASAGTYYGRWGQFSFPIFNHNNKMPALESTIFFKNKISEGYLSKITFPLGTLHFYYSAREDLLNDKKLDSISLVNKNNKRVKSALLNYVYSESNNPLFLTNYSTNEKLQNKYPYLKKRLFLSSVVEKGQEEAGVPYVFEYENINGLPPRLSFSQDYFGYFNGKVNKYFFPNDTYYKGNQELHIGGDRRGDFNFAKTGLLKKITNPLKGSQEFEYESNILPKQKEVKNINSELNYGLSNTNKNDILFSDTITGTNKIEIRISTYWDKPSYVGREGDGMYVSLLNLTENKILINKQLSEAGESSVFNYNDANQNHKYLIRFQSGAKYISFRAKVAMMKIIVENGVEKEAGGVRVKGLTVTDRNIIQLKKTFHYSRLDNPLKSSAVSGNLGWLSSAFLSVERFNYQFYENATLKNANTASFLLNSNSVFDLYASDLNKIVYENVTEYFGNDSNNGIEHTFDVSVNDYAKPLEVDNWADILDFYQPLEISGAPTSNTGFLNGKELYTGYFRIENGNKIYQKKIYNYFGIDQGTISIDTFYIIKQVYNRFQGVLDLHKIPAGSFGAFGDFDVNRYLIYRYWDRLDSTRIIEYFPSGIVSRLEKFEYNNLQNILPTAKVIFEGDLKIRRTEYKYPQEMISAGNDPTGIYAQMIASHIMRPAIEVIEKNSISNSIINWRKQIYYNPWSQLIMPKEILQNKKGTNDFYAKIKYIRYDEYGNVVSLQDNDGVVKSYIYSYRGQYPVFELIGVDYSTIISVLGGENFIKNFTSSIPSEAQIISTSNQLRIHENLKNVEITNYVYDPLLGMTSKTDAKGQTEYYQYDGLQRLQHILDQFQQLRQSYHYHYRP